MSLKRLQLLGVRNWKRGWEWGSILMRIEHRCMTVNLPIVLCYPSKNCFDLTPVLYTQLTQIFKAYLANYNILGWDEVICKYRWPLTVLALLPAGILRFGHPVQCSVYSVQFVHTMYSVQFIGTNCTVFSVQCTVCTYNVQCAVYRYSYSLQFIQCTVYSLQ